MPVAHDQFQPEDDGIDLLDIFLTVAENIKLLVLGPLVAVALAAGVNFSLPPVFESVAVLQIGQTNVAVVTTAAALDPVVVSLGLAKQRSADDARAELKRNITVTVGKLDKLCTLVVRSRSAQEAQTIAKAVLEQLYVVSRPKGSIKSRLEAQKVEAAGRLASAQSAGTVFLKRVESIDVKNESRAELARGYSNILASAAAAQAQILAVESQLEGVTSADVLQEPTLAQTPNSALSKLLLGVFFGTAFLLLIFVFVRQSFSGKNMTAESSAKIASIRQALGLSAT